MPATKLKVTLKRLYVSKDASFWGPGDWKIDATVKREATGDVTSLGDANVTHEAVNKKSITLDWSKEIAIESKDTKITIKVKATQIGAIFNTDVGTVEIALVPPITHGYNLVRTSSTKHYTATVFVSLPEATDVAAGVGTTILQNPDSTTHSSLHDEIVPRLVHICPVIPVPWADGIPPVPRGAQALTATPQYNFGTDSSATARNAMINPAVICVLDPTDPDFATKCARVGITQKRPRDLSSDKFIWSVVQGNVKIWDGSAKTTVTGGEEINVYATSDVAADETVKIELRWDGPGKPLLATYLAWAGKVKQLTARANILVHPTNTDDTKDIPNPTITAADVKARVDYANIILWQVGIQIVLDTNATCYNGAVASAIPGIFTVSTAVANTFNIVDDGAPIATLFNSRANVFNLAYIHSMAGNPNLLGMATDRRLSDPPASPSDKWTAKTVSLGWAQSQSWVRPIGVFPDDPPQTINMKTMAASALRTNPNLNTYGDGKIDKLSACLMLHLDTSYPDSTTMAHELGHVIGLHHRGNGGFPKDKKSTDGVNHLTGPNAGRGHPWEENLMCYGDDLVCQDLDWLQAQVVRSHALLVDAPVAPVAPPAPPPPPPPPPPKPVPADGLPTEDDRKLIQEYLIHKREGLAEGPYDLGSFGPAGDGVDGVVGSRTKAAIKQWQADHGGLQVDGIYGPKSHAAMDQELNPPPP